MACSCVFTGQIFHIEYWTQMFDMSQVCHAPLNWNDIHVIFSFSLLHWKDTFGSSKCGLTYSGICSRTLQIRKWSRKDLTFVHFFLCWSSLPRSTCVSGVCRWPNWKRKWRPFERIWTTHWQNEIRRSLHSGPMKNFWGELMKQTANKRGTLVYIFPILF